MNELEFHAWMLAEFVESRSGNVTSISDIEGGEWSRDLFRVYEEASGSPLSVARGTTGSYGPLYAPRVLQVLGRDLDEVDRAHLILRMVRVIHETGNWVETFSILRDDPDRRCVLCGVREQEVPKWERLLPLLHRFRGVYDAA